MIILGIDTSAHVGGTAVVKDGKVIAETVLNIQADHSRQLLPAIAKTLQEAQLELASIDGIAAVQGPGSFTGLRIGIATTQGFGYTLNKPVLGMTTMAGLAWQFRNSGMLVCPVIDARRNEVFTQLYRGAEALTEPLNCSIAQLVEESAACKQPILFVGEGIDLFRDELSAVPQAQFPEIDYSLLPSSVAGFGYELLSQGKQQQWYQLMPFYMRKSSAEYQREAMEMKHES